MRRSSRQSLKAIIVAYGSAHVCSGIHIWMLGAAFASGVKFEAGFSYDGGSFETVQGEICFIIG